MTELITGRHDPNQSVVGNNPSLASLTSVDPFRNNVYYVRFVYDADSVASLDQLKQFTELKELEESKVKQVISSRVLAMTKV